MGEVAFVIVVLTTLLAQSAMIWLLVRRESMLHQRIQDRDDRLLRDMASALLRVKERAPAAAPLEMGGAREAAPRAFRPMDASIARDLGVPFMPPNGAH